MPMKIPHDLPARETLEHEGVLIIRDTDAIRQDIRPMRIALLNLMPKKIETETQIARVLAGTPLQVEMTLFAPERSEEHTSELQSLMRISYAVFCLKKKKNKTNRRKRKRKRSKRPNQT